MNALYFKSFQQLVLAFTLFYISCVNCMPFNDESDVVDIIDLSFLGNTLFGIPTNKSGDRLEKWRPESGSNPEEQGEYLEGDILHPPSLGRNGIRSESYRWKNAIIPYEIHSYYSNEDRDMISRAMDAYHKYTCIRFVPKSSADIDYIWITNEHSGCWSSIGRIGGRQQLNLQSPGCLYNIGTPIHELMHAVGFTHEQNRPDRDGFVNIIWSNIQPGRENNFQMAKKDQINSFQIKYDYRSVMHYGRSAFGIDGRDTIKPANFDINELGQRKGFSRSDIEKINRMYKCNG